jgi:hypothetical protein
MLSVHLQGHIALASIEGVLLVHRGMSSHILYVSYVYLSLGCCEVNKQQEPHWSYMQVDAKPGFVFVSRRSCAQHNLSPT